MIEKLWPEANIEEITFSLLVLFAEGLFYLKGENE